MSVYSTEVLNSTGLVVINHVINSTRLLRNTSMYQDDCQEQARGMESPVMFYAVFSVIFFVGLVANITLIVIFVRHRVMRTAPNIYIWNLAVVDLLMTLSCASSPLVSIAGDIYPSVCIVLQIVMQTTMALTSFTLIALSAERYYAIAHPLRRNISSKNFTIRVVVLIWFGSLSYALGKKVFKPPDRCPGCIQMYNPSSFARTYTIIDFLALYIGPLVIIAYFYILMAKELYFSTKSPPTENFADVTLLRRLQARKRIAGTVLILVAMFALFYLPFNLLSLKLYFSSEFRQTQNWGHVTTLVFCAGCLHNSFNPLILYSMSKSFRDHFNNYLFYNILGSPVPLVIESTSSQNSKKTSFTKS